MRIRRAEPHESERLREIAIAAKGYWGYDRDRIQEWGAGVDVDGKDVFVAERDGRAVAWASLVPRGEVCWLEDLWVEPNSIGTGVGSHLFRHAAECARQLGAARLEWEAEPNAIGFYQKMGGRFLRDSEPTEWGRILRVLGVDLHRG